MFREVIRQSWERSRQYNIPTDRVEIPSISEAELVKRKKSAEHIVEMVDTFIVPLQKVLKDRDYALGFFDADGVLIKVYQCNSEFADIYRPGKVWLERYTGTTAVGIALATEKVAVVDVDEHYSEAFKSVLAIGHPIIVCGNLQGVLSLAIAVRDGVDYLVNLVSVVASRLEEQLMLQESFQQTATDFKSLEEVLRTFIHEIKNPLTNIRAFLQLQQIRAKEKSDYDKIIGEVDRISEMIANFRYFSVEKQFNFTQINLADLLMNLRDTLKGMFDLKGWKLELHLEDDCYIMGNENKLKQVFLNIIKNAYEAIDEDGIVELWLDKDELNCNVRIIDNGEGISLEEQELIFQPFYTTKSAGYGLGLAVCRDILLRHRGDIRVKSEKHMGTTVTVSMPCEDLMRGMVEQERVAVV